MPIASDNFQRPNGGLGANWTNWTWSGSHPCQIASNLAEGSVANSTNGDYWNANSFGADQFSTVTISAVPTGGDWTGCTIRQAAAGAGDSGYLAIWFSGSFYLFKIIAGGSTAQLGSSVAGSLATGDTLSISVTGTAITVSHNGTTLISLTDATYAAGAPGIAFYGVSGSISGWQGGDVSGGGVTVTTTAIANVAQGVEVRRWLSASGGAPPYAWTVSSGSLPAGMTLASDGTLGGTPTATGTSSFAVKATDTASASGTASLSITSVSAPLSPTNPTTDANGVITYSVTSSILLGDAESIRVLQPTAPNPSYPHGFLFTLPVAAGTDDTSFGNGLDTIRTLGLHNQYNLTVIEASSGGDWFADNPSNASLLQETYMLQVAAWAKANYGTTGTEKLWLIGFSRSGIGGQGLFLHRPDLYAGVASWDFPAMMTGYAGADPNGTVGGSSASSYGTQDSFASNYELSAANLAKWVAGTNLTSVNRMWIGGYAAFQADVSQYDPVLTAAGIQHTYSLVQQSSHNWAPTPGWVGTALAALLGPGGVTPGQTSRPIVRLGIAQYFGGTNYDSTFRAYRNGPLNSSGLSTVRAFQPKRLPDFDYVLGQSAGRGMGAVMVLELNETRDTPLTMGQMPATLKGQRLLTYPVQLHVFHMAHKDYAEDAEADVDALDQAIHERIYQDPTLGGICYQAGIDSYGIRSLIDPPEAFRQELICTHFRVCFDVQVAISIGA